MQKILFLSYKPIFPAESGYPIRAFNIAKSLTKKYEVDLLFLTDETPHTRHIRELKTIFHKVFFFPFPKTRFIFNGLMGITSPLPLQVEYFYNHMVRDWVKEHYQNYDLLFCSTIRTMEYARGLEVRKVVDLIDDLTLAYGEFSPLAPPHLKIAYFVDWLRVKRYHRNILPQFERIFITSKFDADHLSLAFEEALENVTVLPNGARDELFESEESSSSEERALVIFGTMDYLPNRDGALFFLREIFPDLKKNHPDLIIRIIGRNPPRSLSRYLKHGVHVHGFVADPYPIIRNSQVVVTPVRAGAGISNKTLEAMALRRANVISPIVSRGIGGRDGEHYFVAKNKTEWIEKISAVLRDEALRRRMGESAHNLVRERYRWDTIGAKLEDEIKKVLAT